jgi:phosphopantothenoylcysteine decarboxylase/phosphopantothenate--cysteine ligase
MLAAVEAALPADAAVFAAAVADWRVENAGRGEDEEGCGRRAAALSFAENPDILASCADVGGRPRWWWASPPRPRTWSATRPPSGAQGLRLDRGQRRLARDRDHGRDGERRDADHRDGAEAWPRMSKDETAPAAAGRAHRRAWERLASQVRI